MREGQGRRQRRVHLPQFARLRSYPYSHYLDIYNTVITALSTLAVAVFTYTLAKSTKDLWGVTKIAADAAQKSANVAESTLIATQRPWIEITGVRALSDLKFDADGGRITIHAGINVVGQTPALNVTISGEFFLMSANGIDALERQRQHCEEVQRRPVFASRPPMFAGPSALSISLPISSENIEDNALPDEFIQAAGVAPGKRITPVLVGCIYYRFAFADGWHLSRFAYHMHEINNAGEPTVINVAKATINNDRLRFDPFIAGGFDVD